jgi:hypothetical protein
VLRPFDDDVAARNTVMKALELRRVLANARLDGVGWVDALIGDLQWKLHGIPSFCSAAA